VDQMHAILGDLPLLQGFADRRAKIQAGHRAYSQRRQEEYAAYAKAYFQWQRDSTTAIGAGEVPPKAPQRPDQGENLDGVFASQLAAVDDEERTMIAGMASDLEARAREHEQRQIAKAMELPPPKWGPILEDLSLLCATIRHVRRVAAMVRKGGAAAPRFGRDPDTGLVTVDTIDGELPVTRETVDEVDLVTAWKDGFSLTDPIVDPEPLRLEEVRDGVQVDRKPSPTNGQVKQQYGVWTSKQVAQRMLGRG